MGPAGLGDGSVVIVARGLGTERRVASGPPAERRSAVRHVNGEARLVLKHILEIGETLRGVFDIVPLAPAVEPRGIIFAAHQGSCRTNLAELSESVLRIGAEVYDR